MSKLPVKPETGKTRTKVNTPGAAQARPRLPSLNARMRTRRGQLGLTGLELAQRAGISPSYVSLIEKGTKVPDEDVAARIALALEDDQELYRAWARAVRLGLDSLTNLNHLQLISREPAYRQLVESGHPLPRLPSPTARPTQPHETSDFESRLREVASRLNTPVPASPAQTRVPPANRVEPAPRPVEAAPSDVEGIQVPVLAEGADPGGLEPPATLPETQDRLLLDRRLVAGHAPEEVFACEVTAGTMTHLRGVAAPGDRVVFARHGRITPDRICAVRTQAGLVLSRVLVDDRSLLLLPGEGEHGFSTVEVPDSKKLGDVIAGVHILLLRR